MRYIRYTLDTATSDPANSMTGISQLVANDICYVQESNHYFRYDPTSVATPNGSTILAPDSITAPAAGRWLREGPPGPALLDPSRPAAVEVDNGYYDYLIRNREDLVLVAAPVGNVFTLPPGSYSFAAPVSPNNEETILVNTPGVVLKGMTPGDGLIGNSTAPFLVVDAAGELTMEGMTVSNGALGGGAIDTSGIVEVVRCDITCASATNETITETLGTWRGFSNDITGPNFRAVIQIAGDWYETGSRFNSITTTFDNRDGAGIMSMTNCEVLATQNGARLRGARVQLVDCLFSVGQDNSAALAALGVVDLEVIGGRLTAAAAGTNRSGLHFSSGGNNSTILSGVTFDTVDIGIRHTDAVGTYNTCVATGLKMETSVTVGIAWSNGLIPTNGLALAGCAILGGTPFSGFSMASARVNGKSLLGAGALLTETAIVP